MNLCLTLKHDDLIQQPATAWFIVGPTAEHWLAELAEWRTPLAAARLYVVPTSRENRVPAGVLVLGAAPGDGRPSPRSLAYCARGGRLYVPCDARFEPELAEIELAALLEEIQDPLVWHPQAALIALSEQAAIPVSRLLMHCEAVSEYWTAAVAGVALNSKIVSLEPDMVPSAEDVFAGARDGIGTQDPDLDQLPPVPGEPAAGPLGDLGRALGQGMARAMQWLAKHAPTGAGASGWASALEKWAAKRMQRLSQSLTAARNRELLRLMNLLEKNPDEGLKFALPMGGDAHRGIAPPSARLGPRIVDFHLGSLRGGQPADFWNMPADFQQRLISRYRELAAREIALGRHRRAAYIFAKLLNDVRSAASTLTDGGHYREAAVLYEERLHQPELAANCLRQGGLRSEAIAIYIRLNRHETVGDLYAELEQLEEAEAAWTRAVAVHLAADDVLQAARLLESKLRRTDDAFTLLAGAWPRSRQASSCLTEAFLLAAHHGRHEQAAELIDHAAGKPLEPGMIAELVELLSAQVGKYPDTDVRCRAADRTRIVAAHALGMKIEEREAGRLVAAIRNLVPEDRLLERDGHRYLRQRREPTPARSSHRPLKALVTLYEVQLPALDWRTAVAADDAIYAAGFRERELFVVRTDWRAREIESLLGRSWEVQLGHVESPILLAASASGSRKLIVQVAGKSPLPDSRWFRATDQFPTAMLAGPHPGVSSLTHGVCYSGNEAVHVVDFGAGPSLVVRSYLTPAPLAGVSAIDFANLAVPSVSLQLPLPCCVCDETLCLGVGRNLCLIRGGAQSVEMPRPVTEIIASPPHTRPRVAVAMEQGGMLLWGNNESAAATPFASDMAAPRIALTRDGSLVAASQDEIEIYSARDARLTLRERLRTSQSSPLAVVASRTVNRFGLLYRDGRLLICEIPV